MSNQPRKNDASHLQEAAEEEELRKLEKEVEQMAQKILEYRTTFPAQLSSTLSSLLVSQRPVLPAHGGEEPETRALAYLESEAGTSQGLVGESTAPSSDAHDTEESKKIELLKQKISSNAAALPLVLNRMKEFMARIDQFESSIGIIHPAFKRKAG